MGIIPTVYAHEAYVLTADQFNMGLGQNTANPLSGLLDPSHLMLTILITLGVILSYLLINFWSATKFSDRLDKAVKKVGVIGPLIIRVAISASFFFAAQINVILGPELSLSHIAYAPLIRFLLFLITFMILFGVLVEWAALIDLVIFFYVSTFFGQYMLTYTNYFGELIVLFLFGSRFVSFDRYFFGTRPLIKSLEKLKHFEVPIVRILYGVALIYAGYTIKFLHQSLSIAVYNEYHLQNFFHASAGFIASGAGLSEILIGLFILIGFATRWTILISLVFITLSILYFREMLWPHFMLYGISFSLIINSGDFLTVDHYLVPWLRSKLHW